MRLVLSLLLLLLLTSINESTNKDSEHAPHKMLFGVRVDIDTSSRKHNFTIKKSFQSAKTKTTERNDSNVALYDFNTDIVMPPDSEHWLNFKRGDQLHILEKNNSQAWMARHQMTQASGFVLPFMVGEAKNGEAFQNIHIAMEDFDAGSLEGFLSYRKGDLFSNITKFYKFWTAKSEANRLEGVIDGRKVAKHLAIALFKYKSYAQKGDFLYIIDDPETAESWKSKSVASKQDSFIPTISVLRIPMNTKLSHISSDSVEMENVLALSSFDGQLMENFLSFNTGESLSILQKPSDDTWVARSSITDKMGFIPKFMVASPKEVSVKDQNDDRKIFRALQDSTAASLGLGSLGFLSYSKGAQLYIISGRPEDRIWFGRVEDTLEEGYIARADVMDQCNYPNNYDFRPNIRYGDQCVPWFTPCQCGDTRMDGYSGTEYCCVPPSVTCTRAQDGNVTCPEGQVLPLSEPCHHKCYNDYKTSLYYHYIFGHYTCQSVEKCVPILDMCHGNDITGCGDVQECDSHLRCWQFAGTKLNSLATDIISSHHFCSYPVLHYGTHKYEYIDRSDENLINPVAPAVKIDYSYLESCTVLGQPGVPCHYDGGVKCLYNYLWCRQDQVFSCYMNNDTKLSTADKVLCQNATFWGNHDVNLYNNENEITLYGSRCRGRSQHSYYTWYYSIDGSVDKIEKTNCEDQSHRVHMANTSCPTHATYLQISADKFFDPKRTFENTTEFGDQHQDPHGCWDSCKIPGPNCEACTRKEYFLCEQSNMCIHEDLVCDGHPQCQNEEDEDFNRCKEKWTENEVFSQHATVRCRSKIYPSMDIISSPCDGIVECHDFSDEIYCSDNSISHILIVVSILGVITLYFGLHYRYQIIFTLWGSKESRIMKKKEVTQKKTSKEEIFEEFKNNHHHLHTVKKVQNFLLYIIYSQKKDNKNNILKEFYDHLNIIKKKDEAEVYIYLKQNFHPVVITAIDKSKFPGLAGKLIDFIEETSNNKFISKLQDKFTINDNFRKCKSAVQTICKLLSNQVDQIKDLTLTITLLSIMGGLEAIYYFPTKFPALIVLSYAGTIIVPMLLSILHVALNDPYLIFLFMKKTAAKLNRILMIILCIVLSFFNYAFLIFNFEETQEKAITKAKKMVDDDDLFAKCELLKREQIQFVKIDLG